MNLQARLLVVHKVAQNIMVTGRKHTKNQGFLSSVYFSKNGSFWLKSTGNLEHFWSLCDIEELFCLHFLQLSLLFMITFQIKLTIKEILFELKSFIIKEFGHKYFPENVKMIIHYKFSPCKLNMWSSLYCESFLCVGLCDFQTIFNCFSKNWDYSN